jgi:hypothetical protein
VTKEILRESQQKSKQDAFELVLLWNLPRQNIRLMGEKL